MLQNLMRKMKKGNKGFTLVELMIVVVIIGILIAIAIPIYRNIRENAEYRACAANRRTIMSQMTVYAAESETGDTISTTAELTTFLGQYEYFAQPPVCPAGGSYTLVTDNVVSCTTHLQLSTAP